MATEVETEAEAQATGYSSLIGGIVQDARQLLTEQMNLFQVEIKNDLRRTVMAVIPLIVGSVVTVVGMLVLLFGAAHFVNWLIPDMPSWGGFAIVGGLVVLVGGGLMLWGKTQLSAINPLPDVALQGLKENLQWKTKK